MTAMARATSHVGLVSTVSTTFSEPFLAARMLASLDHISGGRVGWNVVTSMFDAEARNHGMEALPGHGQRYERAAEFIEVALRLWDSWDDEALVQEPDGMYADPALVRPIDHAGEHFRVSGPLTVPRSSQGRPVLFHAGASGPGRELAARYAEGIYAVAYDLPAAQSDYADLKKRIGSAGRDPASVAVMPGLVTYVGSTEAEAVAKQSRADALLPAKQPRPSWHLHRAGLHRLATGRPGPRTAPARAVQRSTGPLRDDPADRGGRGAHGAAAAGPSRGRRRALHHGRHPRAHRRPDRGVVPLRCR